MNSDKLIVVHLAPALQDEYMAVFSDGHYHAGDRARKGDFVPILHVLL